MSIPLAVVADPALITARLRRLLAFARVLERNISLRAQRRDRISTSDSIFAIAVLLNDRDLL